MILVVGHAAGEGEADSVTDWADFVLPGLTYSGGLDGTGGKVGANQYAVSAGKGAVSAAGNGGAP